MNVENYFELISFFEKSQQLLSDNSSSNQLRSAVIQNSLKWLRFEGSLQRKVFRKFLKVFHLRGRTSLKDANANCTWLNENRIAEDTGGKVFSY